MNKRDLANVVANKLNMPASEMEVILDTINETIINALKEGDHVTFWHFGRFEVKYRAPRVGRSFKTGKCVTIPERKKIWFSVSPALQEAFEKDLSAQAARS